MKQQVAAISQQVRRMMAGKAINIDTVADATIKTMELVEATNFDGPAKKQLAVSVLTELLPAEQGGGANALLPLISDFIDAIVQGSVGKIAINAGRLLIKATAGCCGKKPCCG